MHILIAMDKEEDMQRREKIKDWRIFYKLQQHLTGSYLVICQLIIIVYDCLLFHYYVILPHKVKRTHKIWGCNTP